MKLYNTIVSLRNGGYVSNITGLYRGNTEDDVLPKLFRAIRPYMDKNKSYTLERWDIFEVSPKEMQALGITWIEEE